MMVQSYSDPAVREAPYRLITADRFPGRWSVNQLVLSSPDGDGVTAGRLGSRIVDVKVGPAGYATDVDEAVERAIAALEWQYPVSKVGDQVPWALLSTRDGQSEMVVCGESLWRRIDPNRLRTWESLERLNFDRNMVGLPVLNREQVAGMSRRDLSDEFYEAGRWLSDRLIPPYARAFNGEVSLCEFRPSVGVGERYLCLSEADVVAARRLGGDAHWCAVVPREADREDAFLGEIHADFGAEVRVWPVDYTSLLDATDVYDAVERMVFEVNWWTMMWAKEQPGVKLKFPDVAGRLYRLDEGRSVDYEVRPGDRFRVWDDPFVVGANGDEFRHLSERDGLGEVDSRDGSVGGLSL